MPAIGEKIGGYELLASLGGGAYGKTYSARGPDGATVVLKFPDRLMIGDPAVFGRFERELSIGNRLQHERIARAFAMGDGPDGPYLVQEFVEGESLRFYLHRHGPLTVPQALGFAGQLAEALAYMHGAGVYHRDIKPENVVVTGDSDLHIIDFGIALMEGARRLTWSLLSEAMGTPDYMAPEQILGRRGDARTDIYALGCLLYEMLTGQVPFKGETLQATMSLHLTESPAPPRSLNDAIPPQVEAIVLKATRRDPDERYQSAAALAHDLESYADLDLADFVFGPELVIRRPMSDRQIWLLSAGVGGGFFLASLLAIGAFVLIRSL